MGRRHEIAVPVVASTVVHSASSMSIANIKSCRLFNANLLSVQTKSPRCSLGIASLSGQHYCGRANGPQSFYNPSEEPSSPPLNPLDHIQDGKLPLTA